MIYRWRGVLVCNIRLGEYVEKDCPKARMLFDVVIVKRLCSLVTTSGLHSARQDLRASYAATVVNYTDASYNRHKLCAMTAHQRSTIAAALLTQTAKGPYSM